MNKENDITEAITRTEKLSESLPKDTMYIGERTISIAGRGLALHLPKQVAQELGLIQGDRISIWVSNDYIVLKKKER